MAVHQKCISVQDGKCTSIVDLWMWITAAVSQLAADGQSPSEAALRSGMAGSHRVLLTCLVLVIWRCNEPFSGSCLGRKMIRSSRHRQTLHMSERPLLVHCHFVPCLMFFRGLTFSWRMFIVDRWALAMVQLLKVRCLSRADLCFLYFPFRPWSKWPVNRLTPEISKGLSSVSTSLWTSDFGRPAGMSTLIRIFVAVHSSVFYTSRLNRHVWNRKVTPRICADVVTYTCTCLSGVMRCLERTKKKDQFIYYHTGWRLV